MDNLETLSLKDNNILLIPASALGRLPQLGALRLDYNRIAALSGEILRSMAERVSSLVLARNVVRELPPATFQHFRQLQHLDLTGNLLTSLAADTFSGLEGTLRTLRAPQNKITALTGTPLALAALQLLDLSDNRLMELPRDTFALLPSLVHLNLSGNPLTTASALPSGLLHRMPLLETLDASRAGLRALPADLLAEANNMRAVYMSGNVILELGDGTFVNMHNLTVVDLSHNGMTSIKPRAFVNTMGIRILKLNGNQLSSFKGEMFNTGTGLETIDLSDNELGYLFPSAFRIHPRLQSVSVARNKLTFFPAELIAGLQYLEHVDLSGNALKTLDELDFARLPRLRVLDLANNQIDSVSEMSFHNSTQLQLLNLADNMIDRLGDRTFEGLVRLEQLNLEGNLLAELPDTIFERARLQMLENVNLARNQFEIAPLKALQRQYFFVSSVNLSRNRVKDIPADDSVMVNIKTLDLSFNPLSSESIANVLGEPKTVRELHLAGCNVTHVTRLETPFLRYLNISHNDISTLSDTAFERTSLLETLDLSHNQLDAMPTAWPMLTSLQTLNVSYNPIASISQTDLTGLDSLRHLSMHDLHECTRIERNAFRAVPNLAALDAYGYPKLGYLDVQGLLQHVPSSLECLNIETKEPALSADQLKPALQPRLRELGVMGSRLKTISSGTLSGVKAANIVIRLRNTSLTHLPPALFFPVPRSSAVTLDLAGSTLATLTAQTLAALDDRKAGLHLLGLDSNPIVCDCSARALWRWLPQHADVTVRCNSPERFAGKLLLDLEEHQLTCLNAMHEHQPLRPTDESSSATTEQLATVAVQPAARSTTEAEIIWSVMAATDRARPKAPTATVGTGNDDTLIIGIVGGVVAFIAILIIVICVIRLRTGSDHVAVGSGLAGHAHYPGHHLGPAMLTSGPGSSSCACSTKGGAGGGVAPAMYAGYAATTLPHKMTTASAAGVASRHAYSTMGRVPPYYQNAPQPYFVAAYPTADDKIYR